MNQLKESAISHGINVDDVELCEKWCYQNASKECNQPMYREPTLWNWYGPNLELLHPGSSLAGDLQSILCNAIKNEHIKLDIADTNSKTASSYFLEKLKNNPQLRIPAEQMKSQINNNDNVFGIHLSGQQGDVVLTLIPNEILNIQDQIYGEESYYWTACILDVGEIYCRQLSNYKVTTYTNRFVCLQS